MEETLAVAAAVRAPRSTAPSHEPQDGGPKSESSSSIQLVAEILGIQRCFRTLMGNEMIRGVSGGEKKRTSIAEVFMAATPVQSWDNTTRGLDSLTALRIIEAFKKCASVFGTCVMISVYQASQAIYDQFDKVSLLYEGRQIYFGKSTDAVGYFWYLGFVKSERQSTADFLTSLTNPAERVHMTRQGYGGKAPRSVEDFAAAWANSAARKSLIEDINSYDARQASETEAIHHYYRDRADAVGHER